MQWVRHARMLQPVTTGSKREKEDMKPYFERDGIVIYHADSSIGTLARVIKCANVAIALLPEFHDLGVQESRAARADNRTPFTHRQVFGCADGTGGGVMTLSVDELRRLREMLGEADQLSYGALVHFVTVSRRDSAQPRGWLRDMVPRAMVPLLAAALGKPPVSAPVTLLRETLETMRLDSSLGELEAVKQVLAVFDGLDGDELDVLGEIVERLKVGKRRFGQLVVSEDGRDFDAEARSELVDFPIWSAMASLKRRGSGEGRVESEEKAKPRRTKR